MKILLEHLSKSNIEYYIVIDVEINTNTDININTNTRLNGIKIFTM